MSGSIVGRRKVLERLAADADDLGEAADLVRAALRGEDPVSGPVAWLERVTVRSFRGIGPEVALELVPGPGLVLIVGPNGSGKSSLAEGLEVLLTGDSCRFAGRSADARAGWRNLSEPAGARITGTFAVEGGPPVEVERTWGDAADLGAAVVRVRRGPETVEDGLAALGWASAVRSYRPVLGTSELQRTFDGGPSVLFDALRGLLGLEEVVAAQHRLGDARRLEKRDGVAGGPVERAERWVKRVEGEVRAEAFEPLAQRTRAIWDALRQASSVELSEIRLAGSADKRRVELDVSVDGRLSAALSVMSQGELHALALALFLPRATQPASPFRFVVVDDPVQCMDPSKVDGLARVLAEEAVQRQVVVFTHDPRLEASVRRAGTPARVVEVSRRAGSVVELRDLRGS